MLVEAGRELGAERLARAADLLDVAVEADSGRVQVEKAHLASAGIAERVHHVRGHEGESTGADRMVAVRKGEHERACEDVEGVRVQPVHVQVWPALTACIARLGDDDILEREPDAHRPLRRVRNRDGLHEISL